ISSHFYELPEFSHLSLVTRVKALELKPPLVNCPQVESLLSLTTEPLFAENNPGKDEGFVRMLETAK
ncbi:MAG: hypothetical protein D6742_11265, partial [Cyanobacteria bacterium J069]